MLHPSREDLRNATVPTEEESLQIADRLSAETSNGDKDVMLLKRWNGKLLAEKFQLPGMEIEIERAVEQVEKELEVARKPANGSEGVGKAAVAPENRRDQ